MLEFESDDGDFMPDGSPEHREHAYASFVVVLLILAKLIFGGRG